MDTINGTHICEIFWSNGDPFLAEDYSELEQAQSL